MDDEQVSGKINPRRTSYVLHKLFHQSYLILEFKWSPILILDSCRFELIKITFLSQGLEEFPLGFGCVLKLQQVFLISSSSSAKYKLIQDLLVSYFLLLLWLMFDLMNWPILVYTTCCTCRVCDDIDVTFWWFMIKHVRFRWKWNYDEVWCI